MARAGNGIIIPADVGWGFRKKWSEVQPGLRSMCLPSATKDREGTDRPELAWVLGVGDPKISQPYGDWGLEWWRKW